MNRKTFKRSISLVMCVIMSAISMPRIMAKNDNAKNYRILSEAEAQQIEDKVAQINCLKMELIQLEKKSIDENCNISRISNAEEEGIITDADKVNEIEKQIDILKEDIVAMGGEISIEQIAQNIDMRDALSALNSEYAIQSTHSSWHPSEIAEQFEDAYDIVAYVTFGENLQQQYHIIFSGKGKDPYLSKTIPGDRNIVLSKEFAEGSSAAQVWLDSLVKIYADKLIGTGLGLLHPIFNFLPWELLTTEKPSVRAISSDSNSSTKIVSPCVNASVKFVYVYNDVSDTWSYVLSTSRIFVTYSVNFNVYVNGTHYNSSKDYNNIMVSGDYDNAKEDASQAFSTNRTMNTCINRWAINYRNTDVFEFDLHTPNNIGGMFY